VADGRASRQVIVATCSSLVVASGATVAMLMLVHEPNPDVLAVAAEGVDGTVPFLLWAAATLVVGSLLTVGIAAFLRSRSSQRTFRG
jgi:hypothetical protein